MNELPTPHDYLRKISNPRLAFPISTYSVDIQYLPIRLNDEQRLALANYLTTTMASLVRAQPEGSLEALESTLNTTPRVDVPRSEGETTYVSIQYLLPGEGFAIQLGPQTLRITKTRSSLEELVSATHFIQKALDRFFPPLPPDGEPAVHSLDTMLGLSENTYRVSHYWETKLRVTSRVNNRDLQVTNRSLMDRLLRLDSGAPTSGNAGGKDPLAAIQLQDLRRADISVGGHKQIDGRMRSLWFTMEAPYNLTRRDVDLAFSYRMGEGAASLDRVDLSDMYTPMVSFYRDLVLNRFMEDLFFDIGVEARL